MLGWILAGLAIMAVGVIVISGMVTKSRIKEEMRSRNFKDMMITEINNCTNTIKLEDLDSDRTIEIQGDDIDSSLYEYETICA